MSNFNSSGYLTSGNLPAVSFEVEQGDVLAKLMKARENITKDLLVEELLKGFDEDKIKTALKNTKNLCERRGKKGFDDKTRFAVISAVLERLGLNTAKGKVLNM